MYYETTSNNENLKLEKLNEEWLLNIAKGIKYRREIFVSETEELPLKIKSYIKDTETLVNKFRNSYKTNENINKLSNKNKKMTTDKLSTLSKIFCYI